MRFFPQGQHVALMEVKFGMRRSGPLLLALLRAKFHLIGAKIRVHNPKN